MDSSKGLEDHKTLTLLGNGDWKCFRLLQFAWPDDDDCRVLIVHHSGIFVCLSMPKAVSCFSSPRVVDAVCQKSPLVGVLHKACQAAGAPTDKAVEPHWHQIRSPEATFLVTTSKGTPVVGNCVAHKLEAAAGQFFAGSIDSAGRLMRFDQLRNGPHARKGVLSVRPLPPPSRRC